MTSLGLKIVGEEMEVGFTVSSRDELNVAIDRLYAMADTIWPSSPAGVKAIGDEYPIPEPNDKSTDWAGVAHREVMRDWREQQGLR